MLLSTLALCFILFISGNAGLSCTARSQCLSVSTQINYVECIANQCACLASNGFSGNATVENRCQCPAPAKVSWLESGEPFCFAYTDALAYRAEQVQEEFQMGVVQSVYNQLVWPGPRDIMIALITGQPSVIYNYFANNSKGRVDPVGTFSTHDGIVEYFYGLTWTGAAKINKVVFKKLITRGNIVHSNVVMSFDLYDQTQQNIIFSYNLTQSGSFTFDANKKISSVDLIIHNLGAISDQQSPRTPEYIGTICYIIFNVAGCNSSHDPQGYYTDFPDCIQSFSSYEWGSYDRIYFNGNTTTCRFFHLLLAIGRPSVHCSHAGKTGGGKCQTHDYNGYFLQDYKKRAISPP